MRKFKIVAVLMSILIVGALVAGCSCSSGNSNSSNSSSNSSNSSNSSSSSSSSKDLVGSWEYTTGGYTYTFKDDGTGTYDVGGKAMNFTYKTDGDKLSITYEGSTAPFETTYSVKGNELDVKDSLGSSTIYKKK